MFTASNVSLRLLMSRAFGVAEFQIEGGPSWVDGDKYDVAARADTSLEMSREELRPCLQALLAKRFRLRTHRQTKTGSVYSLVAAKNGPKLREHSGGGASGIGASSESGKADIAGTKATMARLAEYLSGQGGRPVIDNTGLRGEYDFRVEWAPDETAAPPGPPAGDLTAPLSGPSIFTALQEQLGLKLEATKGPIEIIVIDSVEKPSAN
jgi:uncharacterized protein (TIGR03435 family)